MKRVLVLVATMMLASIAPVAAGGDHHTYCPAGGDYECPPPEPKVLNVEADVMVCGDPRMWVRVENTGTVDTSIKWVFRDGNKAKGAPRKVVTTSLPAGVTKVLGARWVLGSGAPVKIKFWRPQAQYWAPLLKFENQWGEPWGTAGCPADRFGTPSWDSPRYTTR